MKIKSLSFNNYKAFLNQQTIEIRPITVLIGKNSSGKSSIAKLFTLLENSLSRNIKEPLLYNNNGVVIGGEFRDLVFNRQPSVPVSFSILFEDDSRIKIEILSPNNGYNLIINSWELISNDFNAVVTYSPSLGVYIDQHGKILKCQFSGFLPDFLLNEDGSEVIPKEFFDKYSIIVDYIGPFRIIPDRQFQLDGKLSHSKTGVKGEFAYPILATSELANKELEGSVGDWFKKYFNGWGIKVNHQNRPFFEVVLEKDDIEVNIVDVGQGINQVLPLIVRSFIPSNDTLVIIEQPELHLHPAAHADLAELFAKSALNFNQNFLIETHSENFILRLRKLIVANDFGLKPEDVVIYWIDDADIGQEITEITIDGNGKLTDWPSGVFNENLDEILQIKKAIKNKSII